MAHPNTLGKASIVVAAVLGVGLALGLGAAESATRASLQQLAASASAPVNEAALLEGVDPVTGGGKLFAAKCNVCHPHAKAGLGPALLGEKFAAKYAEDEPLRLAVRTRKGGMPGYSVSNLSEDGLSAIIAYLRSLP